MSKLLETPLGKRFGRLVVIGRTFTHLGKSAWVCQCDCGNQKTICPSSLRRGASASCGCLRKEQSAALFTTHGMRGTKEYRVWSGMIQRCTNPKLDSWKYYGAKGVKVCDRWLNSFENFSADMGCCPPDMTLERIDGNKDYEPSNCKWDTVEAQANNRSNNRRIAFGGKIQTLAQWSKITGIDRKTISDRIEAGYPMQTALWAIPGTLST